MSAVVRSTVTAWSRLEADFNLLAHRSTMPQIRNFKIDIIIDWGDVHIIYI